MSTINFVLTGNLLLGPNGIRALRGLGLLDPVLSKVDDSGPDMRRFQIISGMDGHEAIIEVRLQHFQHFYLFLRSLQTARIDRRHYCGQ